MQKYLQLLKQLQTCNSLCYKKKSLSVCESEINEEVYVCDREEIMK